MVQTRRHFLQTTSAVGLGMLTLPTPATSAKTVITVRGPIRPDRMGRTFSHEHALVDFVGAERVDPNRYDADEAFEKILPYLEKVKRWGGDTFVDCTPNYLGRDVRLLRRLSEATGLHLLTNTGLYGAQQGKFLPEYATHETAEQLAQRWTDEFQNGIDGTGIRPGFVKIGVNDGPLADYDRKLVRAAALTHRKTGLTIAVHTGDAAAAKEELAIIRAAGVHPSAFIWVHAQGKGAESHLQLARAGTWVEIDGISEENYADRARQVLALRDAGLLDRVLVSCDAGWYRVGEPNGGEYRSHVVLLERFIPELEELGFDEAEVQQLLVSNPAQAFAVRVRL